jgi:hypothetical protein
VLTIFNGLMRSSMRWTGFLLISDYSPRRRVVKRIHARRRSLSRSASKPSTAPFSILVARICSRRISIWGSCGVWLHGDEKSVFNLRMGVVEHAVVRHPLTPRFRGH